MDWLLENKNSIWGIVTAAFMLAWAIAKVTPTKKDDEFLGKIQKWFSTTNK